MRMPYLLSSFILLLFTTTSINAQKLGLRAEYGVQNLPQESTYYMGANRQVDFLVETVSVTASRSVGLYTQYNYGWLFFQPEVLYTTYQQTLNVESFSEDLDGNSSNLYTEKHQQIDLPVYAGVKIRGFKVGAGPVLHLGKNIQSGLSTFDNLDIKPSKVSTGFQAGVGYDFKIFSLDVKYQREFDQATTHVHYDNSNRQLSSSLSSVKVGVAVAIGKK